jgi:hypothetical protein
MAVTGSGGSRLPQARVRARRPVAEPTCINHRARAIRAFGGKRRARRQTRGSHHGNSRLASPLAPRAPGFSTTRSRVAARRPSGSPGRALPYDLETTELQPSPACGSRGWVKCQENRHQRQPSTPFDREAFAGRPTSVRRFWTSESDCLIGWGGAPTPSTASIDTNRRRGTRIVPPARWSGRFRRERVVSGAALLRHYPMVAGHAMDGRRIPSLARTVPSTDERQRMQRSSTTR